MNGQFYYRSGQQQIGPISAGELKQHAAAGRLRPGDLCWTHGMANWQPASQMPDLFPTVSAPLSPPPLAVPPPPPPARVASAPPPPPPVPPPAPASAAGAASDAGFLKKISDELARTGNACVDQVRRVFSLGRTSVDAVRLAQQARAAQERLGQRMNETGQGDPALREQLVQLVERRKSVEAVKGPTKLLDAERRGLFIRLAEKTLAAVAPQGLENEHAAAVALKTEVESLQQRQGTQSAGLFPTDGRDRLRVALAAGALGLMLLIGLPLAWGIGRRTLRLLTSSRPSPESVEKPGDDANITPVETPSGDEPTPVPATPIAPTTPGVKDGPAELWMEEDGYFPKRKAVAKLVKGKVEGEGKYLDDQGRLIGAEHYKNDVLQGKRTCYYPSGKKFSEVTFQNGKANGTGTTWFDNGNKAQTETYVNGELTGKRILYFTNGNKFLELALVGGVSQGDRYHYTSSGSHFGTSYWRDGQELGAPTIHYEINATENAEIQERANFSPVLKDHWRE